MSERDDGGDTRRQRITLAAAVAGAMLLASLPVGVVALGTDISQPTGFNTNREELGSGQSPFGRYIMYASTGPEGTCAMIELPEAVPPTVPTRAYYSDCSQDADGELNAAALVGKEGTLVYGIAPAATAAVTVDRAEGPDLEATVRDGAMGVGKRFFVASSVDHGVEGTIRAVRADGRTVAVHTVRGTTD